jgi:hypothetical protein
MQRPADRGCGGPRGVEVVKTAQHSVAGERRPSSGEEPGDVSAFFVNGDDGRSFAAVIGAVRSFSCPDDSMFCA